MAHKYVRTKTGKLIKFCLKLGTWVSNDFSIIIRAAQVQQDDDLIEGVHLCTTEDVKFFRTDKHAFSYITKNF